MGAALALGERGRGRTAPNPCVGCVIVRDGRVVGRGWTQPKGRPHAEAMALAEAGAKSRGATCYATLEPCSVRSRKGPACADLLVDARVTRVVAAIQDPYPKIDGRGFALLRSAGIDLTTGVRAEEAERSMAGFLMRQRAGRPQVTLKLALSLDGAVATADGSSRWITGPEARAHAHLERSRHEAILVGRATLDADSPRLDVRLPGLEARSPRRFLLTRRPGAGPGIIGESATTPPGDPSLRRDEDWESVPSPRAIASIAGVDHLLVEGGAETAAAFLAADLVDRLLLYRAPIMVGGGRTLPDIGLRDLAAAHRRWRRTDARQLGSDRLEVYERVREQA